MGRYDLLFMAQYQFLGFSKLRKFGYDLLFMAQYQFLGFSKLRKFRMGDQRASGSGRGVDMAGWSDWLNFPAARFSGICGICGVAGVAGGRGWIVSREEWLDLLLFCIISAEKQASQSSQSSLASQSRVSGLTMRKLASSVCLFVCLSVWGLCRLN